jgi:hypothetical protein
VNIGVQDGFLIKDPKTESNPWTAMFAELPKLGFGRQLRVCVSVAPSAFIDRPTAKVAAQYSPPDLDPARYAEVRCKQINRWISTYVALLCYRNFCQMRDGVEMDADLLVYQGVDVLRVYRYLIWGLQRHMAGGSFPINERDTMFQVAEEMRDVQPFLKMVADRYEWPKWEDRFEERGVQ